MEWFQTARLDAFMAGVVLSVLAAVFATIQFGGFNWTAIWWFWLLVLPWPPFMYLASRHRMSAGADWFKYGHRYIKTYELTSVKVKGTSGGAAWALDLKDSGDRKVWVQLDAIQQNPKLWDLVYNGILHSVRRGGAETNRRAVDRLQLR